MLKTPRLNPRVRSNPSEFWKQHLAKAVQQHFDQERSLLGYVPGLDEDRDLTGANLGLANLGRANLAGASLSGADLSFANLKGANLAGANLWTANLAGADLTGADLRRASLRDADLTGAHGLSDEQKADFKRRGAIVD